MADSFLEWLKQSWSAVVAFLGRLHQRITGNINRERANRSGTKLAILGPLASGKTTVHCFLETGVLITEYEPTLGAVVKSPTQRDLQMVSELMEKEPIHLYLAERIDVSGDFKTFSSAWKQALSDAFFVIFLYDASKFIGEHAQAKEYRRLVVDGCDFAGGLIAHADTKIVFAATHCDLVGGWALTQQGINRVQKQIWHYDEADEAVINLAQNTYDEASIVFGSLKGVENAENFLYSIFE
jgi:hypothetical protein